MGRTYSQTVIDSPIGPLTLQAMNGKLCGLHFGGEKSPEDFVFEVDYGVIARTKTELEEYFAGKRKTFTVPVTVCGTNFQSRIWDQLRTIPYGETRTYSRLAADAGSPGGARAAGMACHSNPIGIIIPCHRVLSIGGKLTGFAGGLDVKRALLKLEGIKWKE